jgi:hypothetical protein
MNPAMALIAAIEIIDSQSKHANIATHPHGGMSSLIHLTPNLAVIVPVKQPLKDNQHSTRGDDDSGICSDNLSVAHSSLLRYSGNSGLGNPHMGD